MILAHLYGGLGNQMFQYAAAKSTAERLGVELKLDISHLKKHGTGSNFTTRDFELDVFNINERVATFKEVRKYVPNMYQTSKVYHQFFRAKRLVTSRHLFIERQWQRHKYIPRFEKIKDNSYLYGYFQTEKYFETIAPLLCKNFTLKSTIEIGTENTKLIQDLSNENSVSVHIRRGDYSNSIFTLLDIENYYAPAVQKIFELVENPKFYIFSNDLEWAKMHIPRLNCEFSFVDLNFGNRSFMDLVLMSYCKHNVIANSSFSWWGAWLNNNPDKRVIAPLSWYKEKGTADLIPESWIKL